MTIRGKKIVILGGSSGIGKATAKACVEAGAHVIIASRSEEHLTAAEEEIGGTVTHTVLDVRDVRSMDYYFEQLGVVDHLVITAAEAKAAPFLEVDLEEARQLFEIKFWGQFAAAQQAACYIPEGGSITFFSGLDACKPVRGFSVVAAANGAVEALTRSLAVELSPVRVNAVSPGLVDTHGMEEEERARLTALLPVRRIGEADDIAHAVLFLMQNPFTTGTVLYVDGGNRVV